MSLISGDTSQTHHSGGASRARHEDDLTQLRGPGDTADTQLRRTGGTRLRRWWAPRALYVTLWPLLNSCQTAEDAFTADRIEQLCDRSVPICDGQASCVLSQDQYVAGAFPGGLRVIVRTEAESATLIVRTLLTAPRFPGTEYQVSVFSSGCESQNEVLLRDVDLFELAGDDRTIEHHLKVEGRGDHLVELFSDMSSAFLFRVDVE